MDSIDFERVGRYRNIAIAFGEVTETGEKNMEDDNNTTDVDAYVIGIRDGAQDASEGNARMCSGRTDAYIDGYNTGFLYERVMQTLGE